MKYFLFTAQNIIDRKEIVVTGTMQCPSGFFTPKELGTEISIRPISDQWNIMFLMEITEEQYNYYNKG